MFPQPTSPLSPQPVRARIPLGRPRWTYVFLAVNVVVFVLLELSGGSENARNLIAWGANYAPYVDRGEYWRLFTANFLHIGYTHVFVNSYSLFILGQDVEAFYGNRRFVALYLLSALSGAVASYLFTHGLSAGASTALFGLFGALGAYYLKHRDMLGAFGRQRLTSLAITLALNIIIAIAPGSRIDNFGHLGGLVGGFVLGWFFSPRYALRDPYVSVFSPVTDVTRGRPELANDQVADENSLSRQVLVIAIFVLTLAVLTLARPSLV